MTEVELHFAREVKRCRLQAGLSQEDLAEKLGVSRETVSQIERGKNKRPGNDILLGLERHLGLSRFRSYALLGGETPPDQENMEQRLYRIAAIADREQRRQAWYSLPQELRQVMLQFVQDSLIELSLTIPAAGPPPDPQ